jgi:hypothetical protein
MMRVVAGAGYYLNCIGAPLTRFALRSISLIEKALLAENSQFSAPLQLLIKNERVPDGNKRPG